MARREEWLTALDSALGVIDATDFDEGSINLCSVTRLCARDQGLYTTALMNPKKLENILRNDDLGLSDAQIQVVLQRIESIRLVMGQRRKSSRWMANSRVGARPHWYVEVEGVNR